MPTPTGHPTDARDDDDGAAGTLAPARRPGAPLLLTPDRRVPAPPRAEAAVDPDLLRAMVAEAVRAELRGDTGTRVTRQLRRLIRAEIDAALEARPRR